MPLDNNPWTLPAIVVTIPASSLAAGCDGGGGNSDGGGGDGDGGLGGGGLGDGGGGDGGGVDGGGRVQGQIDGSVLVSGTVAQLNPPAANDV